MCTPTAFLIGAAVASEALTVTKQYEASQRQTQLSNENQKNVDQATRVAYQQQAVKADEQHAQATQQAEQTALKAAQVAHDQAATASDNGVAGLSIDGLINDTYRQQSHNYGVIDTNQKYAGQERQDQAKAISNTGQSRINAAPKGTFNPVMGLLQIGAAGGSAYVKAKYGSN